MRIVDLIWNSGGSPKIEINNFQDWKELREKNWKRLLKKIISSLR
ncbi:MAG: hypothetical protein ACFFCM_07400 [Promethearchaeota archaeon]